MQTGGGGPNATTAGRLTNSWDHFALDRLTNELENWIENAAKHGDIEEARVVCHEHDGLIVSFGSGRAPPLPFAPEPRNIPGNLGITVCEHEVGPAPKLPGVIKCRPVPVEVFQEVTEPMHCLHREHPKRHREEDHAKMSQTGAVQNLLLAVLSEAEVRLELVEFEDVRTRRCDGAFARRRPGSVVEGRASGGGDGLALGRDGRLQARGVTASRPSSSREQSRARRAPREEEYYSER